MSECLEANYATQSRDGSTHGAEVFRRRNKSKEPYKQTFDVESGLCLASQLDLHKD
jgi:hypothetical protein